MIAMVVVLSVLCGWLYVSRLAARRAWLACDGALCLAEWALIHTINGTTPETPEVAAELEQASADAAYWLVEGYPVDVG